MRDLGRQLRHPLLRVNERPCIVLVEFVVTGADTSALPSPRRVRTTMLTRAYLLYGDATAVAVENPSVLSYAEQRAVYEIEGALCWGGDDDWV